VPNTLMVEPTESETLAELDRFIDAMIAIREEIRQIEAGTWPQDDNPLKNAPHTAASLLAADWPHPYSREVAAYPWPACASQVLVARGPRGQRLRRPQPVLQLRAGGELRSVNDAPCSCRAVRRQRCSGPAPPFIPPASWRTAGTAQARLATMPGPSPDSQVDFKASRAPYGCAYCACCAMAQLDAAR
jgi:hypothetical protein